MIETDFYKTTCNLPVDENGKRKEQLNYTFILSDFGEGLINLQIKNSLLIIFIYHKSPYTP